MLNKVERLKISCTGCNDLSFKADIDDLCESLALNICLDLAQQIEGFPLLVKPTISEIPASLIEIPNLKLCVINDALKKADVVLGAC